MTIFWVAEEKGAVKGLVEKAGGWWRVETLGILRCAQDDRKNRQPQRLDGTVNTFLPIAKCGWGTCWFVARWRR